MCKASIARYQMLVEYSYGGILAFSKPAGLENDLPLLIWSDLQGLDRALVFATKHKDTVSEAAGGVIMPARFEIRLGPPLILFNTVRVSVFRIFVVLSVSTREE